MINKGTRKKPGQYDRSHHPWRLSGKWRKATTISDMNEEWKTVPGFSGKYEVSNIGSVRRVTRPHKNLKPWVSRGYSNVALCDGKIQKAIKIHRLVLLAFVGPPGPGQEAAHLDGSKNNNTVSNLAWCSHRENMLQGVAHGTVGYHKNNTIGGHFKLTAETVAEIIRQRLAGATIKSLAALYVISPNHVYRVVRGENWKDLPRQSSFVLSGQLADAKQETHISTSD